MSLPVLRDPSGRYRIAGPRDDYTQSLVVAGATSILYQPGPRPGSQFVGGVYIDNEAGTSPAGSQAQLGERGRIALDMVDRGVGLVVVGLYPGEAGKRLPGCVTALEWYPVPGYENVPLPHHEAYITQWHYGRPGWRKRRRLYREALSRHPKLVWVF